MKLPTDFGTDPSTDRTLWHSRFAESIRLVIAPVLLFAAGFMTADFLLSGVYGWPRTSRIIALSLTVVVLSYEFVYKEEAARFPHRTHDDQIKHLIYSCVIPYAVGALALLSLARLASSHTS